MRATSQIHALTGGMEEHDGRLVAARAILASGWRARWRMAGFGRRVAGNQAHHGVCAQEGDPEFGISRGRLLPDHRIFSLAEVPEQTREKLQQSLVLVHGGMAQDVGPILEMVTEKYLLRSETEWRGRKEAIGILDEVMGALEGGRRPAIGACTQRNFDGPIQTIIPWARQPVHGHADPPRARGSGRRLLGLLDARRDVGRAWGSCSARAQASHRSGSPS